MSPFRALRRAFRHARTERPASKPPENLLDDDEPAPRTGGALRELVAEIVREELQGGLGERITRNVRKLVRAEIQRALCRPRSRLDPCRRRRGEHAGPSRLRRRGLRPAGCPRRTTLAALAGAFTPDVSRLPDDRSLDMGAGGSRPRSCSADLYYLDVWAARSFAIDNSFVFWGPRSLVLAIRARALPAIAFTGAALSASRLRLPAWHTP